MGQILDGRYLWDGRGIMIQVRHEVGPQKRAGHTSGFKEAKHGESIKLYSYDLYTFQLNFNTVVSTNVLTL